MWTDTLIKVVLPALVDTIGAYPSGANITIYKEGVVGSGSLAIRNQWGGITPLNAPTAYVKVVYGVRDRYNSILAKKKRVILVDDQYPPTTPYYTFYTDSLTKSNSQAISVLLQAFEDWSCYSQIEYRLDTSSVINFHIDSVLNYVNTIRFAKKMTKATVAGETRVRDNFFCNTSQAYIAEEIDIVLKDTTAWWYDLNSLTTAPAGMWDFYEVVLHELGHAYTCQHVRDSTQIMNSSTNNTLRTIDLTIDSSAVAAINTRDFSLSKLPACGWFPPAGYICNTNSIENSANPLGVSIFPNPFEDKITLKFTEPFIPSINLMITNLLGQTLYQNRTKLEMETTIELPPLPKGIYFLIAKDENQLPVFTTKILKQ